MRLLNSFTARVRGTNFTQTQSIARNYAHNRAVARLLCGNLFVGKSCYTQPSMRSTAQFMHMKKYIMSLAVVAVVIFPAAASAATCPAITSDLRLGSRGVQVTALQGFLKSQGYFKATSVPNFGPATLASVRAFQKAHGISQVGTVGPITRAKIKALCSGSASGGSTAPTGTDGIFPAQSNSIFEVTGWIPYWRQATGTADTLPHLSKLTEVNPFTYTLKSDGTLMDNGPTNAEPWLSFNAAAKAQGVRVIPTVMTSNGALVHELLSDQTTRIALAEHIADVVKTNGYDGIDIDFEGKQAQTKDYYSTFLKGLKMRLGDKWLMCTIETRLPDADRYYSAEIPADSQLFANDLKAIGTYCDRVRLMTYDQQRIDMKINADAGARLYAANGDPVWVEKVVNHMSKDIPKNKILIGVPTYGYEYSVTTYYGGQHVYDILWTFNPGHAQRQPGISAIPLSEKYGITPERQYWGELGFTYIPDPNATTTVSSSNIPSAAMLASVNAIMETTANNTNITYRYVVWPDEETTRQKIELAKRLGVRGISIFKLDGGQDPDIWNVLIGAKQ